MVTGMGNKYAHEVKGKQRSIACFSPQYMPPPLFSGPLLLRTTRLNAKRVEASSDHAYH